MAKIKPTDQMRENLKRRDFLTDLRAAADEWAQVVPSPHWKAVYRKLSEAADHLDALIARSSVTEVAPKDGG